MSWVRIDDHAPEHPKQMAAGAEACWLWVRGLAYCSRYLTDGLIPHAVVDGWGGTRAFKLAVRLVNVGLWEYAEDGAYRVHDYGAYQPSKAQVTTRRKRTADRVAAWKEQRGYVAGNGVTNGIGNAVTTPAPVPVPLPVPVPVPQEPTVCVPPAPVKTLTKPLAYKPRIDVAWPGRPPVPSALHAEFTDKLGGDPYEADERLRKWYPVAAAPYEDQPIGDVDWKFWRLRFREWQGTTAKPVAAGADKRATDDEIWADIEAQKALRVRR